MTESQRIRAYTCLTIGKGLLRAALACAVVMAISVAGQGASWPFWSGCTAALLFAALWCRVEAGTYGYDPRRGVV